MSDRWARAILVLFGLAAIAVLVLLPLRRPEIVQDGHSLDYWISQLRQPDSGEAELVISQIGPKTIAFLLDQVRTNGSASVPQAPTRSGAAITGRSVVQRGEYHDRLAYRLMCVFRLMGPPAIPGLIAALQDSDGGVRLHAARAIGAISPDVDIMLPIMVKLLDDPDSEVRDTAVTLLERMQHRKSLVIPALVRTLSATNHAAQDERSVAVRVHAAAVLARLGSEGHEHRGRRPDSK